MPQEESTNSGHGPAQLLPHHADLLKKSGIKTKTVEARGYRSLTSPLEIQSLGFHLRQYCAAPRHVLRDLRLSGKIKSRKLGRKTVCTRPEVLAALEAVGADDREVNPSQLCIRRKT